MSDQQQQLATTTQYLTDQKLQELAANPQNQVFYYDQAEIAEAEAKRLTVTESRKMVSQIRSRTLELHSIFPKWTVKQIQNKLCRERTDFAQFQETHTTLFTKIADPQAPPHHLTHVKHMLDTLERQEKGEITADEAKELIAFYIDRNTNKKVPKRKGDKNSGAEI